MTTSRHSSGAHPGEVEAPHGLGADEARRRLEAEGPNALREIRGRTAAGMLLDQLRSPFVLLLGGAAGLAFALGERIDAIAIATILGLNAVVGVVQEWRAERSLDALRSMTAPRARVLRDGHAVQLNAAEVVRGDVLLLEAGEVVAADARLLEAHRLSTVEAALTGEALPVPKGIEPVGDDVPLADRSDRVFAGTSVAAGTGRAEVIAIGMQTQLGHIADLLDRSERASTPLDEQLARISRSLLVMCLGIVAVVAATGLARGSSGLDVLLLAVALAVAAVPEGLPAVVTVALAVGVRRMAARNVLVRRLAAVETLGCATVICTDKTGTLTTGQMRVRELWPGGRVRALLEVAAAVSDAELGDGEGTEDSGDPTELALLRAARELGIERSDLEARWPRAGELPFDSERMRMSVVRRVDGGLRIFTKGALSTVSPLCAPAAGAPDVAEARAVEEALATRGLRVLAIASGDGDAEQSLALVGLVGLADPPRASAVEAITAARRAGIRTVMLTGDHETTAIAIADELGLVGPDGQPSSAVYARITPEEKLRIVESLVNDGEIVAMTGDGVNDAPAIHAAHVGIAMGIAGTEVTREAASIVLADDRFASIVEGIREGRAIHDNIRKTVLYLVAGNTAELGVVLVASLAGLPAPLLPIHLLWINLVTDGLPALALGVEPPDQDTMALPPRPPGQPMLGWDGWALVAASALLETSAVLGVYHYALGRLDLATAQTLAFTTLVTSELLRVFAFRSRLRLLPELGVRSNPLLIGVVLLSGLTLAGMTELEQARRVFHLASLSPGLWTLSLSAALIPVSVLELSKLVLRGSTPRAPGLHDPG
ncbi:MAG TPA: cation-translocating P-type ATPase [Deltaproteobacteria bacterium]|nr:cation-translocating P-type ATPase [Deltaproteobacteria bacterium]